MRRRWRSLEKPASVARSDYKKAPGKYADKQHLIRKVTSLLRTGLKTTVP
jgi:hypothetical protein